jgi:orotidine-5'-phosphate decarboxylase
MTRSQLVDQIRKKQSFLCVGLDTDLAKIPAHLLAEPDPVFAFNKAVIDVTRDYCVAYKPNLAFYESLGPSGWSSLEKTLDYIPDDIFTIADAKRGDIGNTSSMYAKTFFEYFNFDAVTVAPYMGHDSVTPFLDYEGKWVIVLGLTSNAGSRDFQFFKNGEGRYLYQEVLLKVKEWGSPENLMFVVGATHPEAFAEIRDLVPDHFLLVPGIGAQGGDLSSVSRFGMNQDIGLLINSSREIIYAGLDTDFEQSIRAKAAGIAQTMAGLLAPGA